MSDVALLHLVIGCGLGAAIGLSLANEKYWLVAIGVVFIILNVGVQFVYG